MKFKRLLVFILVLLLSISVFAACSKSNGSADIGNSQNETDNRGTESGIIMPAGINRKIVYTVNAQIETAEFKATMDSIIAEVITAEGYTESSEIRQNNGKQYAYLVLRIKTVNLQAFINKFADFGSIVSQNTTSEDITSDYLNVEAELEAYQTELTLLQGKMETETDADEIFKYTQRITELNKSINYYEKQLISYDLLIDYSTVKIQLYEKGSTIVVDTSYGTEIGNTFSDSLNSLLRALEIILLVIIAVGPYAILAAAVFFAVFYTRKYLKKRYPQKFVKKEKAKPVIPANNYFRGYNQYNQNPNLYPNQQINPADNQNINTQKTDINADKTEKK